MSAPSPLLLLALLALTHARVPSTQINIGDLDTNQIEALTVLGAAENDQLGSSVSSAGDVNGDGFDDLIVGAPTAGDQYAVYYGSGPGEAYVLFGNATGFADTIVKAALP
jgi:hypothetical protein